jgi:hypothetical protein
MARCVFGAPLIPLLVSVKSAQNPPQSNPQAVSFASQSIAALTGGNPVSDVTLSGIAIWTFGTDSETGTPTAYGKTNVESQLDLAISGGNRSELRNGTGGLRRMRGSTPADNHRPAPHTTAGRMPSIHAIACIPRNCSGHLLEVSRL